MLPNLSLEVSELFWQNISILIPSSWFANRGFYGHIDISDKPAFMLSDGFIRNQKQFTCDKDQFENGSILGTQDFLMDEFSSKTASEMSQKFADKG